MSPRSGYTVGMIKSENPWDGNVRDEREGREMRDGGNPGTLPGNQMAAW